MGPIVEDLPPPPPQEEDPYQVYALRRPHERASSVIPQLPKQPEMADTRLRYRRIAPETCSGSFASLGNHFPRRFEMPERPSLLEELTSDEECGSFAVRSRHDGSFVRRRSRRSTVCHGESGALSDACDELVQEEVLVDGFRSDSEGVVPRICLPEGGSGTTPVSTSPTTPTRGQESVRVPDIIEGELKVVEKQMEEPPHAVQAVSGPTAVEIVERKRSVPRAVVERKRSVSREEPERAARKQSGRKIREEGESRAERKMSARKERKPSALRVGREDGWRRKTSSSNRVGKKTEAQRTDREPHQAVDEYGDVLGITALDGRPISAPSAMSDEMKEGFVLRPEQPVKYDDSLLFLQLGGAVDGAKRRKKRGNERGEREKGARSGSNSIGCRPPRLQKRRDNRPRNARNATEAPTPVSAGVFAEDEEFDGILRREKELSVSFAHRRITAEEAARKPLTALHKLWHMLQFATIGKRRRWK